MTTHMHIMEIESLMRARFEHGQDRRSIEYKTGFRAGLDRAAGFVFPGNPYAPSTAAGDAWFYGFNSGIAAWALAADRAADPSPSTAPDSGEPA